MNRSPLSSIFLHTRLPRNPVAPVTRMTSDSLLTFVSAIGIVCQIITHHLVTELAKHCFRLPPQHSFRLGCISAQQVHLCRPEVARIDLYERPARFPIYS